MLPILTAGPPDAETLLVLAPGAGAPMTSPWMERVSELLGEAGLRVVRFNFSYMAARVETGSRKPPPKAEALVAEYEAALDAIVGKNGTAKRVLIGGKSLGGRVASLAAQSLFERGRIAGLVCLGYPFHPPKKPTQLRTAHLLELRCPALIVQGVRDPFGIPAEVAGYGLPSNFTVHWAIDGDHDLAPRRASGATLEDNLSGAVREIVGFAERCTQAR
jgi:hypothetical protein